MINHEYTTLMTKETFEAVFKQDLTKVKRVLDILSWGFEVEDNDGRKYRLFETTNNSMSLGIVNDKTLVCGLPDFTLESFIHLCNNLDDKKLDELTQNMAFSKTISLARSGRIN